MNSELKRTIETLRSSLKPMVYESDVELLKQRIQTWFNRHNPIFSYLREHVRELFPSNIDILDVGVGNENGISYEPMILAWICEMNNIDYSLTILDNYRAMIERIKNQHELVSEKTDNEIWQQYSNYVGRLPPVKQKGIFGKEITVQRANLPMSYRRKLKNGEIKFVADDIVSIAPKTQYDLVFCMRVLEHVGKEEEQRPIPIEIPKSVDLGTVEASEICAVYNLVESVKRDGYLAIDELWAYDSDSGGSSSNCATEALIKLMYGESMKKIFEDISSSRNSKRKSSGGRGNYSEMLFQKLV